MKFKYGCDPEVFLKLKDKFISADGLFPGTKDDPHKVEKGAIQVDGLALEFNIDPAETPDEFDNNISVVLSQMNEMVKKIDKDLSIEFTPFANFDKDYFDTLPSSSKILGCEPDYTQTGTVKEPPDISDKPYRTAAGHVHIGWTENEDSMSPHHFTDCVHISRVFYGQSYGMKPFHFGTYDESKRLKYYGNSGAFRPKPYGVELRSPSNIWVKESKDRHHMFHFLNSKMQEIARRAGQ